MRPTSTWRRSGAARSLRRRATFISWLGPSRGGIEARPARCDVPTCKADPVRDRGVPAWGRDLIELGVEQIASTPADDQRDVANRRLSSASRSPHARLRMAPRMSVSLPGQHVGHGVQVAYDFGDGCGTDSPLPSGTSPGRCAVPRGPGRGSIVMEPAHQCPQSGVHRTSPS